MDGERGNRMTDATTKGLVAYTDYLYGHDILSRDLGCIREELAAMLIADLECTFPGAIAKSKEFMP
jgi:hypothetical protein